MLARGKENPPPICYICKGLDPAHAPSAGAIPLCPEHYKMQVEADRLTHSKPKAPDGKFVQLVSHGSELYALTEDGSVYLCRIGTKTWVKWHEKRR